LQLKNKRKINLAQPIIGRAEIKSVSKVLRSGNLAQGQNVIAFENEFSKLVNGRACIAVNSGTSGLVTSLMALGIGTGDEVIVPSFTFAATANAVKLVGATPIFVDIQSDTLNMDPALVELAISPKTKALLVVHLYGLPADMRSLTSIASKYGIYLVEDAAQAHLAKIDGKPVGTFGDAAIFSFYPTKNMTTGEGGMVVVQNSQLERTCRLLRNQGMEKRYENEICGFNFRMTEVNAAIGLEQIKKLHRWTEARQRNASLLNKFIEDIPRQATPIGFEHVYHQYTIILREGRNDLIQELTRENIGCAIYYPTEVHKLPSFNSSIKLPVTEKATQSVLSLPVHPLLSKSDLKKISRVVNLWRNKKWPV
jgi:dTDP-4-amino-4,6-dideoxygalactose transaminase